MLPDFAPVGQVVERSGQEGQALAQNRPIDCIHFGPGRIIVGPSIKYQQRRGALRGSEEAALLRSDALPQKGTQIGPKMVPTKVSKKVIQKM